MRLAITGGTGLVGRFVVNAALERGWDVTLFGRQSPPVGAFARPVSFVPFRLDDIETVPDLSGHDGLVHAAFDHIPGRYRGGEGSDPEGFRRRNVLGSQGIIRAAGAAGCRVIFLSSRAVYGTRPAGTMLGEDSPAFPDTLYGETKLAVEETVTAQGGVSLRATGVFGPPGPGQRHKWVDLFSDFAEHRAITPRKATEVHGADLAAACLLALEGPTPPVLNVSDVMVDRYDLLTLWSEVSGRSGLLPARAEGPGPAQMACGALRKRGWQPRGWTGLRQALTEIAAQDGAVSTP